MIRKIIHISLAVLLLVATTGVTLHKHYCMGMGKVKAVSVFEETNACGEGTKTGQNNCLSSCCEDKEQELKIKELETKKTSFTFDFTPKVLRSSPTFLSDFNLISITPDFSHQNYKPPLIALNMPIRFQSFLL